jgi:UDP-glucose 4-epimerase
VNILVTGGAGYVGSHAVRCLLQAGHDVQVLDNLCYGHVSAVPEGRLIRGDISDRKLVEQLLRDHQIESVMHFAAFAFVGESVEKPHLYYQNNVVNTFHLLEAMRAADVKKIVFSSTTATYGTPDEMPIKETVTQSPINPYGFTKLCVENMLADYAHAYGFGYAALRYFNAAGAASDGSLGEDHTPETHLIPIVLQVAQGQRDSITIFGDDYLTPDGTCIRDYIHVDDLASAHLKAVLKLEAGSELKMNLGVGKGSSVLEVIEACRQVTGHEIPAKIGQRRPGDPPELVADASLAQSLLDWQPQYTDIESIVRTAWAWHRTHPNGYGD